MHQFILSQQCLDQPHDLFAVAARRDDPRQVQMTHRLLALSRDETQDAQPQRRIGADRRGLDLA
jgi:hypothetical protein